MRGTTEINKFVVTKLETIGNNEAFSQNSLISSLLQEFPNLKNRRYAANRVNQVLRTSGVINNFKKIKGKDKKIYIIRNQLTIQEG